MGARPSVIAHSETSAPYIVSLRDTETVKRLAQRLNEARQVVLVGNGGIATELAYVFPKVEQFFPKVGQLLFDSLASARGALTLPPGC
jgi:phosphosulfolactate synthase (CoM biosynthesis protein A)